MRGKKAKDIRRLAREVCGVQNLWAAYFWIKRPDGSVVRQLNELSPRAVAQGIKGKGVNRVRPQQP